MRRRHETATWRIAMALAVLGGMSLLGAAQQDASSRAADVSPDTAELSVAAEVQSAISQASDVVVYVFQEGAHDEIVTAMRAGERVAVAPGSYDLRAVLTLEAEERDVRWIHGVSVAAGEHSESEVTFRRGTLLVHARNSGQPLPPGSVTLSVYRAGDVQEEVIDEGVAEEPLDVAPGRYDVKATFVEANDAPVRWLRDIELGADATQEATVEFNSGTLTIQAAFEGGKAVGRYDVYVYYYGSGDHAEPVGYTPAGEPTVLEAGDYDVRAHFFRSHDQPEIWLRDVEVRPGQASHQLVTFPSAELLLHVYDASGKELIGDNVSVHVYASDQRKRPLASARGGEVLILSEDLYDVRVVDTRFPGREIWLPAVALRAGTATKRSVSFAGSGERAPR